MLQDKIKLVINEVNTVVAERSELIHYVAIALLAKQNLFILGDTGQAKSFAVNEFRKRITGAKQFEKLMSKQADEEMLFGRLDLASIIPGNVSSSRLMKNAEYEFFHNELSAMLENPSDATDNQMIHVATEKLAVLRKAIAETSQSKPEMITTGKIPDAEIVFLDELFKANEGVLNSLLTALNERVWTNEGEVVNLPVISFFSASNEIPNFNNPEEKILKPLYDRFQLKVLTEYVSDKKNRLSMLKIKQEGSGNVQNATFTLSELYAMQNEVKAVIIPERINELMDDILVKLRSKGVAVSDRKYFNYGIIAQAEAWLDGKTTVEPQHLRVLVNYLWNKPEEITMVAETVAAICDNPVQTELDSILEAAMQSKEQFDNSDSSLKSKSFMKFRKEVARLYKMLENLQAKHSASSTAEESVNKAVDKIQNYSNDAHNVAGFTPTPLSEIARLENFKI